MSSLQLKYKKLKYELKYLELEETLQQLEFIKTKYPQISKQLTQVETSLRSAR